MVTAKIIKHSVSESGKEIITYELEYPRFIHGEFMTHRVFSRNAASSRAIPINQMIKNVWNNMASPVHWGKNQSGMQAKEELKGFGLLAAKTLWYGSGYAACITAWIVSKTGIHKQVANRVLEPWSHIKVVVTATEWKNFFSLRNHPDAQPEIHKLAEKMWYAYLVSEPEKLKTGEWHLPYVEDKNLDLDTALKLSSSLCAQVSYRKSDDSINKAIKIYDRLVNTKPVHASPFEHQAMALNNKEEKSGNFIGWAQYRQYIKDNVVNG